MKNGVEIVCSDCLEWLNSHNEQIDLAFLDPPFRQGKEYRFFDDSQPEEQYWDWLKAVLAEICRISSDGASLYFMHREKNAENVLRIVRQTGWEFQNLIVWKKKTSAVPNGARYSKHYQIAAFATKGRRARIFNRLRIDLPLLPGQVQPRANGVFVTDVWDDIRELTSGYFAGDEAVRQANGERIHTQQSPMALLLRIILTSSLPGDTILDPFAGSGTTLVVAKQLGRKAIGIEVAPEYVELTRKRIAIIRKSDNVDKYCNYYRFTPNIDEIWGKQIERERKEPMIESLFANKEMASINL